MKKILISILLLITMFHLRIPQVQAQIPIVSLVTGAIKKVIKAIDLKIQQQQNKVIWLQNAQKQLENTMSQLKLQDISEWTEKQRKLYDDYFQELRKVKTILTTYSEVKNLIRRQKEIMTEYNTTWSLLKQDKHFTSQELNSMYSVYSGILTESLRNIEQLQLAITSFDTQMSDGKRLELIHRADKDMNKNISDMRSFNDQNVRLSLSRAQDEKDAEAVKKMYGIK